MYLIPQTGPEPVAHVSAPPLINDQSPEFILKFPRFRFLGVVILKWTTTILILTLGLHWSWSCRGRSRRTRSSRHVGRSTCLSRRDTRSRASLGVLPTQMLDNALKPTKTRKELRIGRAFGLARGSAGWRKDTVDTGLDAIGARRPLVAADFPAATGNTAPRARGVRWRAGGGGGRGHARSCTGRRIITSGGVVHPLRRS